MLITGLALDFLVKFVLYEFFYCLVQIVGVLREKTLIILKRFFVSQ